MLNLEYAVQLLERWQNILDEHKVITLSYAASKEVAKLSADSQNLISKYYLLIESETINESSEL